MRCSQLLQSISPRTISKPSFRPTVERVEDRCAPTVGLYVKSGILIINADNQGDTVDVGQYGSQIRVNYQSGRSGTSQALSIAAQSVKQISFIGGTGNDTFVNSTHLPANADGGAGNDYLAESWTCGGTANGGPGSDTVRGFGLGFGGVDAKPIKTDIDDVVLNHINLLMADQRNLRWSASTIQAFLNGQIGSFFFSHYATIILKNGSAKWTEEQVRWVEQGMKVLLAQVPTPDLLNGPPIYGGRPVLVREHVIAPSPTVTEKNLAGLHLSNGTIKLADAVFTSESSTVMTVIHEYAHQWNAIALGEKMSFTNADKLYTALLRLNRNMSWKSLSGWRNIAPTSMAGYRFNGNAKYPWWYSTHAGFARDYGKSNPSEDWATAWESYFYFKYPVGYVRQMYRLPAAKQHFLDTFFNLISTY